MEQQTPHKEPESSFRGLYRNVRISVKTLDKMIIGGILVILLIIAYGISNNGYTVTFNSRGGTDVPSQTDLMYGDLVAEPEPPAREGYVFAGWFVDENCAYPWDFSQMTVEQSMTFYAQWTPKNE